MVALEATGGKRGEAARMLGIPRRTFYNRLRALEIEYPHTESHTMWRFPARKCRSSSARS